MQIYKKNMEVIIKIGKKFFFIPNLSFISRIIAIFAI